MQVGDLLKVVGDFATGFMRNPGAYGEETDIRRDLFSELHRQMSRTGRKLNIPHEDLAVDYYPERKSAILTPVKTAYPAEFLFDIAVLDTEDHRSPDVTDTDARYSRYWRQRVAVGLHIHLCKPEQEPVKYFKKLRSDLEKFETYTREHNDHFTGLSLLLVQGDFPDPEHLPPSDHFRIHAGDMPDETGIFARIIAENGIYDLFSFQ